MSDVRENEGATWSEELSDAKWAKKGAKNDANTRFVWSAVGVSFVLAVVWLTIQFTVTSSLDLPSCAFQQRLANEAFYLYGDLLVECEEKREAVRSEGTSWLGAFWLGGFALWVALMVGLAHLTKVRAKSGK